MHIPRTYPWSPISKDESTLLRAFAILAIVFHNYLHWVSDSPGENEFTYQPDRVQSLLSALASTPSDLTRLLATYFGHYGVQVFFFLSGYGLTIKYGKQPPQWWAFQKSRWATLFPAIIAAAIGYILYDGIRLGWHHIFTTEGINLIRQMVGLSNFIPDNIYHPIGPWWFIGVILQFYLIAPLILRATRRYGNPILYTLILGSFLLEYLIGPKLSTAFDFNLNHSILGHLDVCALGILLARRQSFNLPNYAIAAAVGLFIAGNFFAPLWITTGVTLLLFTLPALRALASTIQHFPRLQQSLMYIGGLSMYIFLCNGYLRHPLIDWAKETPHWWTSIWTSLVFLGIVLLWAILLRACERKIRLGVNRLKGLSRPRF